MLSKLPESFSVIKQLVKCDCNPEIGFSRSFKYRKPDWSRTKLCKWKGDC